MKRVHAQVDQIDVSGITPGTLANTGLLMCTLMQGTTEIAAVNLIVQVHQEGDQYMREIISPLE
jgi:hypothetical protein